jgi:hypothetical protein
MGSAERRLGAVTSLQTLPQSRGIFRKLNMEGGEMTQPAMTETELLCCPFCGGKAELQREMRAPGLWFPTCVLFPDCPGINQEDDIQGGATPSFCTEAEAVEAWNTRANLAPPWKDILTENERLKTLLNTPHTHDFAQAIHIEAAHQRERWGSSHDEGKTPLDWFWLIGYLAQKAATSAIAGDTEKAKHHTISTAAALANWHAALSGHDNTMRPGIKPSQITGASDE